MGIPLGSQFDLNAGLPIRKYEVVANTTERDAIPDIVRYDDEVIKMQLFKSCI